MWEYRARVESVHDGDTLTLLIDTGFGGRQEEAIRLLNVFAPELDEVGGPEVHMFVLAWLSRHEQASERRWPFMVRTEVTRTDEPNQKRTFTRYVGTVWDIATQDVLNEAVNHYLQAFV